MFHTFSLVAVPPAQACAFHLSLVVHTVPLVCCLCSLEMLSPSYRPGCHFVLPPLQRSSRRPAADAVIPPFRPTRFSLLPRGRCAAACQSKRTAREDGPRDAARSQRAKGTWNTPHRHNGAAPFRVITRLSSSSLSQISPALQLFAHGRHDRILGRDGQNQRKGFFCSSAETLSAAISSAGRPSAVQRCDRRSRQYSQVEPATLADIPRGG